MDTQIEDHARLSPEEYRRRDEDLARAEQARLDAEEELAIWSSHRIPDKRQGLLFDF